MKKIVEKTLVGWTCPDWRNRLEKFVTRFAIYEKNWQRRFTKVKLTIYEHSVKIEEVNDGD